MGEIEKLQARISELERALKPFVQAATGFADGDIYLEYRETDGHYYELYCDDEALQPLMTLQLLEAARVLRQTETE